ncbi:hypothetical protein [Paenibacillus mendelii]|uniref:Copper amine oxidase-like N-terminal domain-containing protein n=1 Tax=Paenibacillus mendelii TaxID=206163 RepID=A0ABV6JDZ4_9BACL|nr:hypothetical protein [Paenibacillus mendelii]MCQ6563610.1 hypothetical protein [Paenibacillus mendelii]
MKGASFKKRFLLAASFAILSSSVPITIPAAASATATSSDSYQQLAAWKFNFSFAFKDPWTGKLFFNAFNDEGELYIIFKEKDGSWHKLPKGYHFAWKNGNESLARIELSHSVLEPFKPVSPPLFGTLLYDHTDNTLVYSKPYIISPGRGYGIRQQEDYVSTGNGSQRLFSIWLKDRKTGVIREIWRSNQRGEYRFHWTNDDQLLSQRYNQTTRTVEITQYDPSIGTFKHLLDGQLWRINPKTNQILYLDNTTKRKVWIYDMNTGVKRLSKGVVEENTLFAAAPSPMENTVTPPVDLDVRSLPELEPQFISMNEADLIVNGARYPLAMAIVSGINNFIPLSSVMAELGLTLSSEPIGEPPVQSYKLTYRDQVVTIDEKDMRNYDNRIFISITLLKRLLQTDDMQLQWIAPLNNTFSSISSVSS